MEMTHARWLRTQDYIHDLFGAEDPFLAALMPRATAAGLPSISVGPVVGRLLTLLASLSAPGRAGAHRVLELGTLAGYSAIWIARGLAPGGRLITVEHDPDHAAFAERAIAEAHLSDRIHVWRQDALGALRRAATELGEHSVDFIFIDALKTEYPDYFTHLQPLLKPGGLLAADNVLGTGSYWIDDAPGASANRDAIDRFNHMVAAHPEYEAVPVPIRQGVLIARRLPR